MSFKRLVLLLLLAVSASANAQTQIQNARVKTRGRMVDGQYVPGKGLPGTVVSIEGITDIGVRNSNGTFSFPVEDNNYYVKSVAKNEYALLDSDAAPKFYNYSEDTLYFVMGMPEQMFEDLLEAKDKIRKTLECEWKNAMAEIKRLKEENRISQEEYLEKLEQLMSNQEKNEDLVNEMAKRYSTLDYDQLDVFYKKVNSYIEEGKLTKADSMLRSRGNVSAQIDAQLEKEESIRHREEEIAKAKSVLMHDKKELEQRCYSYFESFKMQHEYDSAAYYIEQRARIDTLNVEWQLDAAEYLYEQKQYSKAERYLESSLKLSRDLIKSDYSFVTYVAQSLNNLANLYSDTQRYSDAEQMYEESLEIYRKLSKDNPQVYESDVAMALNNLANLYKNIQRYSDAEQMYEESLEIRRKLAKDNPQVYESDVAMALYNLASLYKNIQRYSDAEQMYVESLEIYRKLSKDNPQVYEPYVAVALIALANLYSDIQRYSEAERMYVESLEIYRKLAKDNPQVYEPYVAAALNNLANLYKNIQRYSESEQMYVESLEIYSELSKDNPQVYESDVAMALYNLASLYKNIQRYSESEQMYVESLEMYRRLAEENPLEYKLNVVMIVNSLKNIYVEQNDYVNAVLYCEEEVILCKELAKNDNVYYYNYLESLIYMTLLYSEINEFSKQYDINEELLPLLKIEYNQKSSMYGQFYSTTLGNHSFCCIFMQEFSKAEQYAREGIEVDPTQTFIYTNLASSLLLQGKYKEAEEIYKKYKIELKDSFLSDFEQFETEGIIPEIYQSDVEKIKQLLNE